MLSGAAGAHTPPAASLNASNSAVNLTFDCCVFCESILRELTVSDRRVNIMLLSLSSLAIFAVRNLSASS